MKSPNRIDSYKSGEASINAIDQLLNEIGKRCKDAHEALQAENLSPAERSTLEAEREFTSKQSIAINQARWTIINALEGEI